MAEAEAGLKALSRLSALCAKTRESLEEGLQLKKTSTGAHARTALHDGSLLLLELRDVNRAVWDQVTGSRGGHTARTRTWTRRT